MPLKPIYEIGSKLDISDEHLELYGKYKAKLDLSLMKPKKDSKLILVTAMSPTPAGEGKTTVNIGLSMALNQLGYKAISALREPSLGPCFGMKGGATGGGNAQVLPMEDINLHFTGDIHAITAATNLLAAVIDNHIYHGNALAIDTDRILWRRALDMNDRALRHIIVNDKDKKTQPHDAQFDISVASEVMAILCLVESMAELKKRLNAMLVAYNTSGEPLYAEAFKVSDAMCALLKDALKPNLVQTTEHTPAILHGGPFANIAHGCNSLIATKMALSLGDYVVTEAGFGSDLGAEKFLNIKCRQGDLAPHAVVLVTTIRSLKYQGGVHVSNLNEENVDAMLSGLPNLRRHLESLQRFGIPVVITINRFPSDTKSEIDALTKMSETWNTPIILSNVFSEGGKGAVELAKTVVKLANQTSTLTHTYVVTDSLETKLLKVARNVYGASDVVYSDTARKELERIQKLMPEAQVCIAKTQYSFTDNPKLLGAPDNFDLHIQSLRVSKGAGFVVALAGSIMTMPGLPKRPTALDIYVDEMGTIHGLRG